MEEQTKSSGMMWVGVVVIILALVGLAFAYVGKKSIPVEIPIDSGTDTTVPVGDTTGTTTSTIPPSDKKTVYKNGTYTALGNYVSPGGAEQIKITVTITNDVITDATVTSVHTSGEEAVRFQSRFISGFKSQVIGKNIADVSLSRVSGSSLTPRGWNDAIAKIKVEALA